MQKKSSSSLSPLEKPEPLDPPYKPLRLKSREVSSRFLSPTSPSSPSDAALLPPSPSLSPIRPKSKSSDHRKHRSCSSDESSLIRGLWPSSTKKSNSTLADHLGNDRLIDFIDRKSTEQFAKKPSGLSLNRQRSCSSEFSDKESKENRPVGGSMRFTGKIRFPGTGKSVPPTDSASLTLGRFSVDENAPNRRAPAQKMSDTFLDFRSSESERSGAISSSSSASSRRPGIHVPARFLQDLSSRGRRSSDMPVVAVDNSPNLGTIKRSNSLTAYASATSQWALSPGRMVSIPMSGDSSGNSVHTFSSLRPLSPTNKAKGMGNLFSMGLELFKGKKSCSTSAASSLSSSPSSRVVVIVGEAATHELRMLHNRLLQWRLVNARADAVHSNRMSQAQSTLLNAWASLSQLQASVVQKRSQLEKEKLQLKLNKVLTSQVKPLEAWSDMEWQYVSAVSTTKDCLQVVVSRVPLIEGAKGDTKPLSITLRHATHLTASIVNTISHIFPMAQRIVPLLSELAEVVSKERSLLEEFLELLTTLSNLELQENYLRCHLIRLKSQQQQFQHVP